MKKRIGIFGGSFNPVHNGHLLLARAAKEALGLDEIVFVPCNQSAYRKKLLPAAVRLKMLRAALRGVKGYSVSDVEIKMGGVSRTVDTVRALAGRGERLFLLIGEDQVAEFPRWKEAGELARMAKVCVMARPGFKKLPLIHNKFHFRTLRVSQYEISSTEIRVRVKKNLPMDGLVPPKVLSILKSCRKII